MKSYEWRMIVITYGLMVVCVAGGIALGFLGGLWLVPAGFTMVTAYGIYRGWIRPDDRRAYPCRHADIEVVDGGVRCPTCNVFYTDAGLECWPDRESFVAAVRREAAEEWRWRKP